jgi:hypothetical protein
LVAIPETAAVLVAIPPVLVVPVAVFVVTVDYNVVIVAYKVAIDCYKATISLLVGPVTVPLTGAVYKYGTEELQLFPI